MIEGLENTNVGNLQRAIQALQEEHEYCSGSMAEPLNDIQMERVQDALRAGKEPALKPHECQWCLEGLIVHAVEPERLTWQPEKEPSLKFFDNRIKSRGWPRFVSQIPGWWYVHAFNLTYSELAPPEWFEKTTSRYRLPYEVNDEALGKEPWQELERHWRKLRDARLSG